MSTERITEITAELVGLMGELYSIKERALPLVAELEELSTPLPPEVRAMFLAMKPNKIKTC
jgi:hypothetical protein